MTHGQLDLVAGAAGLVLALVAPGVGAAELAPARADGWRASALGRWFPGYGEVKGNVPEASTPEGNGGYALRLERGLHERLSVGLALSSSAWSVQTSREAGVLLSGSFLDAALRLEYVPLRFEVPGGPLSVYVAAFGGPTLSGTTEATQSAASAASEEATDDVRFDAGYNAGGAVGVSYRPFERFSVFLETGLDWHYAVHARRPIDLQGQLVGTSLPPALVERLWFGQGEVALGVSYHF